MVFVEVGVGTLRAVEEVHCGFGGWGGGIGDLFGGGVGVWVGDFGGGAEEGDAGAVPGG